MSTDYPTSIDTYVTILDNLTTIMAVYINDVQDAVEALQTKVGAHGSSGTIHNKVDNFFTAGRKLYFFENTPPTNWTTESGLGDTVLALKGGGLAYDAAGGTKGGVWDLSNWWSTNYHNHIVFYWDSNVNYSYNVGGGAINTSGSGQKSSGLGNHIKKGDPRLAVPNNASFTAYCMEAYHTHSHAGTYRPRAAVGIVANYDG